MIYVDTSIFIRAITGDDQEKMHACQAFFTQLAENSIQAKTTETVVAEITYVLRSKRVGYALSREDIFSRVFPLLSLQSLSISNKDTVLTALTLFASSNLDFEDALLIAYAQNDLRNSVLLSYDTGFDAQSRVPRREP